MESKSIDKQQQKKLITEIMQADEKDGLYELPKLQYKNGTPTGKVKANHIDEFNSDYILQHILTIKTRGNFLWRLWFLISAPIIWLFKGTIKIK